jgi:hypothetical protein
MVNDADKGQVEALTPPDPAGLDELAAVKAMLDQVNVEPQLPGLVDAPADDFDLLGRAAETMNAKRRARGRPEGSANKRNAEVFDYLEARGFKAPELRLMEIISADAQELAAKIGQPTLEVLKLQVQAARELMPYKFAKKQELNVNHNGMVAHVMMAGRLSLPGDGVAKEFSLTGETVDYQEVSDTVTKPVGHQSVG